MLLDVLERYRRAQGRRRLREEWAADRRLPGFAGRLRPLPPGLRVACPAGPKTSPEFTHWSDLPRSARNYVEFLAQQVGVPASIVSVGPDRRQTITFAAAAEADRCL